MNSFTTSRLPRIIFGAGSFNYLGQELVGFGEKVLLVVARSFHQSHWWTQLLKQLTAAGIEWRSVSISGEPSPGLVDSIVADHGEICIDAVVGIGGGSALDTAKAVAGLLPSGISVLDYLEGVGKGLDYRGGGLPFIAVPTTAGTGSEMTKNAVLSNVGREGFKKSFRHESLVAQLALVDPVLIASCPRPVMAANAMDAFTQLLESYVSRGASPFSDGMALSGIDAFLRGFSVAEKADLRGHDELAYAAMMSGISLAQAGLGVVHGLAAPLGGHFPIPHGVACGVLVAVATEVNIRALSEREPDSPALNKYAHVGDLASDSDCGGESGALSTLQETLWQWADLLELGRLGDYGIKSSDIPLIVSECRGGSMRYNPLELSDAELEEILRRCL